MCPTPFPDCASAASFSRLLLSVEGAGQVPVEARRSQAGVRVSEEIKLSAWPGHPTTLLRSCGVGDTFAGSQHLIAGLTVSRRACAVEPVVRCWLPAMHCSIRRTD